MDKNVKSVLQCWYCGKKLPILAICRRCAYSLEEGEEFKINKKWCELHDTVPQERNKRTHIICMRCGKIMVGISICQKCEKQFPEIGNVNG